MKFLIIGDLHGNKPKIYFKDFDAIIAPGDFCSDAPRKYMFQSLRAHLKNPESKIEWYDIVGRKQARKMIQRSLADGRRILEYLNAFNVPIHIVPGNWDWTPSKDSKWSIYRKNHYKTLISGLKNIVDVYHRLKNLDGYQIIGHGITSGPEYPQSKKEIKKMKPKELKLAKKDYNKLYEKVDSNFKKASKPIIFLTHNVPYNTPLDKIANKKSPRHGQHFGSIIARQMIEKYQPLVCIGGHMHEHFGKCKLGGKPW